MIRYLIAIVSGALVTSSLLFLMTFLIETGESAVTEPRERQLLDFVRVRQEEVVNREERKPEKPQKPETPPPDVPPPPTDDVNPDVSGLSVRAPSINTSTSIAAPGELSYADGEYLPIVRVAPVYPNRALSRGLEGYVDLMFTVTEAGTVKDPVVTYTTSSLFNRAATQAVLKFKYKPRVVDGKPVEVPGVETRIRFQLEK
ncbi:MAG: energy transducer TonB [Pseudomonadota bacterium]